MTVLKTLKHEYPIEIYLSVNQLVQMFNNMYSNVYGVREFLIGPFF